MKIFHKFPALFFSFLALIFLASAQQDEWQIFGEKSINLALEFDEFKPSEEENNFSEIKLKVLSETVYLHNISVHYKSGSNTLFLIKKKLKPGQETQVFTIPESKDEIKKIKMLYKINKKADSKATIVFLGK